jgi:hypothetical protein
MKTLEMLQRSDIRHGNRERKFTLRKSVNVVFCFTYIVYQQPVHSLRIDMTATVWLQGIDVSE